MKVNNRGLYCGLTVLAVSLLTGAYGMEQTLDRRSIWNDGYSQPRARFDPSDRTKARQTHITVFSDDNRYYEGRYDARSRVFTAHDGGIKLNVSPANVHFVNCPFRRDDRVACYWNATNEHMNPGKVVSMGTHTALIQFNDGSKDWINKDWIHGLEATVSRSDPLFDPQPAPARKSRTHEGVTQQCDQLARFNDSNHYYEGHYHCPTHKFTAYDGDYRTVLNCFVYPTGEVFEERDNVACYWKYSHKYLCPGKVTNRGYGHSFVEFHDGSEAWMPNDFIHKARCNEVHLNRFSSVQHR